MINMGLYKKSALICVCSTDISKRFLCITVDSAGVLLGYRDVGRQCAAFRHRSGRQVSSYLKVHKSTPQNSKGTATTDTTTYTHKT